MDTDPHLEALMGQLGEFGPYQLRQHLLHILTSFLAGIHMLSLTFVAPTPQFRCYIEEVDQNSTNPTFNQFVLSSYIPNNTEGNLDSCLKYDIDSQFDNETISCDNKYVYDTTFYQSSRVIDWSLVCDKRWERAFMQTVYMFGVLNGAVFLGALADKYGRKPILYVSGIMQLVAGLGCAFAPNYIVYVVILFFYGMFGSGGAYVTGFVLSMELVGGSKRTICGTAFSFTFAIGVMIVAMWGYLISSAQLLQIIFALHSLLLIGHWWLIDESIRWLWGQGNIQEAVRIAKNAIETNGGHLIQNYSETLPQRVRTEETNTLMDLLRAPTLRCRVLNVAYNWFANSLVYYGLSFNTGTLPGNPFLIFFINGLAELPGYFIVVALVDRTGRRSLSSLLLFLGGFACIAIAFIPKGTIVTTIAMLAKVAVAGSFAIIYNYTAELFPTVIRNSAVGICAMSARFSGMLTPQISLLDSFDKTLPTMIFGGVAIVAAFLALFLPETLNKEMPQTLEDGENFGRGDTAFRSCLKSAREYQHKDEVSRLND